MKVRFTDAGGTTHEVQARAGERLLDAGQRAGLPLEGTCDGDLACATCHVVLAAADFARVPPAGADEEDMLDLVPRAVRTSRLSCQIVLSDAMDGLAARVP